MEKNPKIEAKKIEELSVTEIKAIMLDHLIVIERSNHQLAILRKELQRREQSDLRTSTQGTSNGQ